MIVNGGSRGIHLRMFFYLDYSHLSRLLNEMFLFLILENFMCCIQSNLYLCYFPFIFLLFVNMCLDSAICGLCFLVSGIYQVST